MRILHDEEMCVIREHEKISRALPLRVIERLKFTIECTTEQTLLLNFFAQRDEATERINLVTAAFRIWAGVIVPSFLRIAVSNVLYLVPIGKEKPVLGSKALQTIMLASPAPVAGGKVHRFSKANAETFGQLVRSMEKANYGRMKVAFQRLRMFSDGAWPEQVIDAMIGLEALYCEKSDRDKGRLIAERAAKLIGSPDETTFIEDFLVEAYRLRNAIVHGEDVNSDHWVELTRIAFENDFKNDPDMKLLLSEPKGLPPASAIEALGNCLCRSIQAKLSNSSHPNRVHARTWRSLRSLRLAARSQRSFTENSRTNIRRNSQR
jgi:hypothetical protein